MPVLRRSAINNVVGPSQTAHGCVNPLSFCTQTRLGGMEGYKPSRKYGHVMSRDQGFHTTFEARVARTF